MLLFCGGFVCVCMNLGCMTQSSPQDVAKHLESGQRGTCIIIPCSTLITQRNVGFSSFFCQWKPLNSFCNTHSLFYVIIMKGLYYSVKIKAYRTKGF